MKKPKIFALFFVLLLLQRSFTLGSSEGFEHDIRSAMKDTQPSLEKFHTVFDDIEEIFGDKATSQPAIQFLKGLKYLGGAFAALGLLFSLIDFFNPQPDPLNTIIKKLTDMEEIILKELGEKFASLENDNLKNLYYESERHIKDAARYLSRMSQAKQAKNTELYALFHLAFMKRVQASGIDDLETIISIFSGDPYFISQPFLENIIETYQGDYTKIDLALINVTTLMMRGFLNLHCYIALSDEGLKDGNQQLSNANQELSNGLKQYQNESVEKLIAYLQTVERLQKERLQGYLEANLKTFMTNNCTPQTQREQPCAIAINKQLDDAFGNLFKFTTFCMNKDVKKNYYKGVDMFAVQDVYNMDCVIFWSSPNYNYTESDPNELRALSDQNFNYHKLEDWDQYVILPKDTKHNQWPGFNSTYPSFNISQNEPSQKMVWGRYRETRPGVCRLNIINALEHGQDEYDLDNMVKYFDEFSRTWDLETLPGDLNDKVLGLYFYGEGCDICSVQVFQDAYYEGNSKIFYPEASSNGLTISKTGYDDHFLDKASSLKANCTFPTSQCKFVFGENSSQDRQDSFEFSLSSGQSKTENLFHNGRRNDLNNNVSWLRLIGDCDSCMVVAYAYPERRGPNETYGGTVGYTFVQNSFLNTQISSYFAQC